MTQRWRVSAFRSALDRHPRPVEVSWAALTRALSWCPVVVTADKKLLPAWSPAVYPDGATRAAAHVVEVSCLVFDYDNGDPLDSLAEAWAPWPHVLHTTWSHTAETPKARVVLPLAEPVPAAEWRRAWSAAKALAAARGTAPDLHCSDSSRLYFRPARRAVDWPFEVRVNDPEGECLALDWWAMPAASPTAVNAAFTRGPSTLPLPWSKRALVEAHHLAADPDARRRAAELLGARIAGDVARGVPCPSCGRPDVWFPLTPAHPMGARCAHVGSCGWKGSLYRLLHGIPATTAREAL